MTYKPSVKVHFFFLLSFLLSFNFANACWTLADPWGGDTLEAEMSSSSSATNNTNEADSIVYDEDEDPIFGHYFQNQEEMERAQNATIGVGVFLLFGIVVGSSWIIQTLGLASL